MSREYGDSVKKLYRDLAERREIVSAMIADATQKKLSDFKLSAGEEVFYRARSVRAVKLAVDETAEFKAYYNLPVARPFNNVIKASGVMIVAAVLAARVFVAYLPKDADATPIYGGLVAAIVAAVGWAVAGYLTHRNTIRQSTNSMLFARFSQAQFGEALARFHKQFGFEDFPRVSADELSRLRSTGNDDDWKTASSVGYILNYFELVANGVIQGDLDQAIVQDNIRGSIKFYHDKCWPYILSCNRSNSLTFAGLIRLRTHYREP